MEAAANFSSTSSSIRLIYRERPLRLVPCNKYRRNSSGFIIVKASCRGNNGPDYVGKLVDESMIVLRMRIREIKISESKFEVPSDWMDWEKKYFLQYNADVCEAMGVLQDILMNIRPSLAVGIIALVFLMVPISTALTLFHALQITQEFIISRN